MTCRWGSIKARSGCSSRTRYGSRSPFHGQTSAWNDFSNFCNQHADV